MRPLPLYDQLRPFNARLFGGRLARRTQLLAFCFRGVVIGLAIGAQGYTVNICANVLGNGATRDIGGDAVGIAKYRVAIATAALPTMVPDVTGKDWAANVLADQPLELAIDVFRRSGSRLRQRRYAF